MTWSIGSLDDVAARCFRSRGTVTVDAMSTLAQFITRWAAPRGVPYQKPNPRLPT
jgi:hypothetical protein